MVVIQKCKPLAGISLNYEVVGGTTTPTTFKKENTIWVNTDIELGEHCFSYENPWIYYEDVNLLEGVTLDDYYLTSSGGLAGPTAANPEKYTVDYIPVSYNTTYSIQYTVSTTKTMWFAICEYTGFGTYTFKQRLVPVASVSGTSQSFTYTPSASTVTAVRLSWRTFPSTTYTVSFVEPDAEFSSASIGDIWIKTNLNNAPVSFNAIKKNELIVYPYMVKQWDGNGWKNKDIKIHKDNSWSDIHISTYIISNGAYTGDWSDGTYAINNLIISGVTYGGSLKETFNSGFVTYSGSGTGQNAGSLIINQGIDLTNINALKFEGTFSMYGGASVVLAVQLRKSKPSSVIDLNNGAVAMIRKSQNDGITSDIFTFDTSSLTGVHYLNFSFYANGGTAVPKLDIINMWLE